MFNALNSKSTIRSRSLKHWWKQQKGFNLNDGPLVKGIAVSLDAIGVHRQKYYGGGEIL